MAGEQRVLAVERAAAHAALDGVGIDLDAAIMPEACVPHDEIAARAVPVIEAVGQRCAELAALRHAAEGRLEPRFQSLDDRLGFFLAHASSQFGRLPADVLLDRIELLDARERFRRDRCPCRRQAFGCVRDVALSGWWKSSS